MGPLSHSYAAAGFFPRSNEHIEAVESGACVDSRAKLRKLKPDPKDRSQNIEDDDNEQEEPDTVYNQTKYWLIDENKVTKLNKHFLICAQTSNLRSNFLYWDAKSKETKPPITATTLTTLTVSNPIETILSDDNDYQDEQEVDAPSDQD